MILFIIIIFFLSVTTITLERLNQSEPNFHKTFDWNSLAKFENGHRRSYLTPLIGGFYPLPQLKIQKPPISTNQN